MPQPPLDDAMGEALAVVRDYEQLNAALRARVDQLGISLETLDHLCGFWAGYSSHLLAPKPQGNMRCLGKMSLGSVLGGVGLKIVLVEDRDALAKVRSRLVESDKAQTRKENPRPAGSKRRENVFTVLGRAGGHARMAVLSAKQRIALSRKANRARWSRAREAAR
jgi:hypothetical protein